MNSDDFERDMLDVTRTGFSLVELMIVIAIIGIISAISIPTYQGYIQNVNMVKVNSHYEQGIRYIQNELRRIHIQASMGESELSGLLLDNDTLLSNLNAMGGTSPSGEQPYGEQASDVSGIIGVAGADAEDGSTYSVTVTRPAYGELASVEQVINYADL